ncbi:hypothetical protein RI129_012743 [Pyrocoelia pectoralis]|uniref:NADP-dependent oxidoreductase domain-containing protein n=1 Tax=Pyrocoelia pectoralis TaxID=417401 RepID=A0AAN7V321_9COLE
MKTLKLNNGHEIPVIGFGTFKSTEGEANRIVKEAIDVGYRHFDCAYFYGNEQEIGAALTDKIKDGTVKRDDLFITTKLWNNFHDKESVLPMLRNQLKSLQLEYVDLYLMHWPFGFKKDADMFPSASGSSAYSDVDYLETWKAMEECVRLGLARSIGISNFNTEQITRLLNAAQIKPAVNQIEVNPNINQKKLIQFCKDREIVITGYCPLGRVYAYEGSSAMPKPTLLDERVLAMREKYNKSAAQIVIRYLLDLGITIIPKSTRKERMIENLDVFDFELEKVDVEYLDSLDRNARICGFINFKDHKYFPFNIEY